MHTRLRTIILVAGVASAILTAPSAAAKPDCVSIGPNTTQCQNPGGSAQIITSPPPSTCGAWGCGAWGYGGYGGYGGWGWGPGLFIGI